MMILVDSSVWIDYLRSGDDLLSTLLLQNQVCMHSMVLGELACGNLRNRSELMSLWQNLPTLLETNHAEALLFLETYQLMGTGIGFVDLHLLASTRLNPAVRLWSRDKRLDAKAFQLGLQFMPN